VGGYPKREERVKTKIKNNSSKRESSPSTTPQGYSMGQGEHIREEQLVRQLFKKDLKENEKGKPKRRKDGKGDKGILA